MNSVSKNVYVEKLDHIVDKYSNTYYGEIKMKPTDEKSNTYIDFNKKKITRKILNLKLVIM